MAVDLIVTKYAVAVVTTTHINHACKQLHRIWSKSDVHCSHDRDELYVLCPYDWCLPWRNHGLQWRILAFAIGIEVTIQH